MMIRINGEKLMWVPESALPIVESVVKRYYGKPKTEEDLDKMREEILSAIDRGYYTRDYAREMYETHCMGLWNTKEENNMNIPGKLKEDVKRIYGAKDPLDYIEDVMMRQTPDMCQLDVVLRVPHGCERYVPNPDPSKVGMKVDYAKDEVACPIVPIPERVIYSGRKTIVFWADGTKTMVSLMEGQEHDEYGAFCAAVVKKMFGATHKAKKFLDTVKVYQASNTRKSKQSLAEETAVQKEESCNG